MFLRSALPLTPPELNPGHGHQNVADIRGGTVRSFINIRGSGLFYTTSTAQDPSGLTLGLALIGPRRSMYAKKKKKRLDE